VFEAMVTNNMGSLSLYMEYGFDLDGMGEGPQDEFLFTVDIGKIYRYNFTALE
jgi:hypothetical protein